MNAANSLSKSKKILAIGNAGGGKSTLCRVISRQYNISLYSIDHIQWKPGWIRTSDKEYAEKHEQLLKNEEWIIDGFGPWEFVEQRFAQADTIIFVDLPLHIHYYWATKRQFKCLFKSRMDGPPGCHMLPVTFKLYKMIWHIHKELCPKILDLVNKYKTHKFVIHLTSVKEVNLLLNDLLDTKAGNS